MGAARQPRETPGSGIRTAVVEAHAIDERPITDQPEQPRRRIAGLRDRRDGADLDVAESEVAETSHREAVLVEAGGDTEWRREREPERLDGQGRVGRGESLDQSAEPERREGRG